MAVPKRRTSRTSRDQRRSHHFKTPVRLVACAQCKAQIMPHTACPECGTYKKREVLSVKTKASKSAK